MAVNNQIWTGVDILANQAQMMISERNEGYDRIRKLKETVAKRAAEKLSIHSREILCAMEPGWDVEN